MITVRLGDRPRPPGRAPAAHCRRPRRQQSRSRSLARMDSLGPSGGDSDPMIMTPRLSEVLFNLASH